MAASLVCLVALYAVLLGLAVSIVVSAARFATLLPAYEDEFTSSSMTRPAGSPTSGSTPTRSVRSAAASTCHRWAA